ncbi:MAG: ABC transporter permease subunit [Chloroflexi bacterium]|nr:ABC transporter permease subunit [Chloroflexota bacterium]
MLRNVFWKSLRDQRRALAWWGIGLVLLAVTTLLFYPAIRDSQELIQQAMQAFPKELLAIFAGEVTDIASPVGFLNTQLFFFMAPLLFLAFAIAFGSGAIAGEEERGTLDLLLANPVARRRVVVEKFAAMVVATIALATTFWAGLTVGSKAVGMEINVVRLAEMTVSLALLGLVFGSLALAFGAARGNSGLSIGVASALGVAFYFANALAPAVEALEPLRNFSPFYYYIGADPLTNGLNLAHAGVLAGLSVLLLIVALVTFERRDLRV